MTIQNIKRKTTRVKNLNVLSFDDLKKAVKDDKFWQEYLYSLSWQGCTEYSIHLAVLRQPFLNYLLDGTKTVESRFSSIRCAPYRRVEPGDVVLLKQVAGPVIGLCRVDLVWFYELDPESWLLIKKEFAEALCALDPEFWESRKHAAFATLLKVDYTRAISPIACSKWDRRGWVVLKPKIRQMPLSFE